MIYIALCVGEVAVFLALICLYRAAFYVDIFSFLQSRTGVLFLCSSIILTLSVLWVIRTIRFSSSDNRKLAIACAMNALMLILTVSSLEIGIRLLSTSTSTGETFRGVPLYPQKWTKVVARYKATLERMTHEDPFLIYEPILGWTVGPSRRNSSGQDISSAEGLRAPQIGMTFTDRRTRHSGLSTKPVAVRIALIGDSMTYGYEVRREGSW